MKNSIVCMLAVSLICSIACVDVYAFNRMYVFGDSLSDQGNLASIDPAISQSPFNGRLTNGRVALEFLADDLGLTMAPSLHLVSDFEVGTNYAVAGAKVVGTEAIDLSLQISAFLSNNSGVVDPGSLYVFFIGGNDIRAVRDEVMNLEEGRLILNDAAAELSHQLNLLASAGGQSFLVINSVDLSVIPETRRLALDDESIIKFSRKLSRMYNRALQRALLGAELFEYYEINIAMFNLQKAFHKLLNQYQERGRVNTIDACLLSTDCDFENFVFFDEIHPTARVHRDVGRQLISVLSDDKLSCSYHSNDF